MVPPKVKLPELSPVIQVVVVEPSYVPIANCLSPVAEAASTSPIITLPSPLVILFSKVLMVVLIECL